MPSMRGGAGKGGRVRDGSSTSSSSECTSSPSSLAGSSASVVWGYLRQVVSASVTSFKSYYMQTCSSSCSLSSLTSSSSTCAPSTAVLAGEGAVMSQANSGEECRRATASAPPRLEIGEVTMGGGVDGMASSTRKKKRKFGRKGEGGDTRVQSWEKSPSPAGVLLPIVTRRFATHLSTLGIEKQVLPTAVSSVKSSTGLAVQPPYEAMPSSSPSSITSLSLSKSLTDTTSRSALRLKNRHAAAASTSTSNSSPAFKMSSSCSTGSSTSVGSGDYRDGSVNESIGMSTISTTRTNKLAMTATSTPTLPTATVSVGQPQALSGRRRRTKRAAISNEKNVEEKTTQPIVSISVTSPSGRKNAMGGNFGSTKSEGGAAVRVSEVEMGVGAEMEIISGEGSRYERNKQNRICGNSEQKQKREEEENVKSQTEENKIIGDERKPSKEVEEDLQLPEKEKETLDDTQKAVRVISSLQVSAAAEREGIPPAWRLEPTQVLSAAPSSVWTATGPSSQRGGWPSLADAKDLKSVKKNVPAGSESHRLDAAAPTQTNTTSPRKLRHINTARRGAGWRGYLAAQPPPQMRFHRSTHAGVCEIAEAVEELNYLRERICSICRKNPNSESFAVAAQLRTLRQAQHRAKLRAQWLTRTCATEQNSSLYASDAPPPYSTGGNFFVPGCTLTGDLTRGATVGGRVAARVISPVPRSASPPTQETSEEDNERGDQRQGGRNAENAQKEKGKNICRTEENYTNNNRSEAIGEKIYCFYDPGEEAWVQVTLPPPSALSKIHA